MRVKKSVKVVLAAFAFLLFAGFGADKSVAAEQDAYTMLTKSGLEQLLTGQGKGKVVMINFFASWCPPCKQEMPMLVKFRANYPESEVLLVGVSADENMGALRRFTNQYKVNFPVYLATTEVMVEYEVTGIPRMLIFDKKGMLVEDIIGAMPEDSFERLVKEHLGSDR